jgi:hypothetical protein
MFEHRASPLLPQTAFYRRLACSFLLVLILVATALGIGMVGYHWSESLPWVDSFANAAMILSGMGPLDPLRTTAGKFFGGFYALFSGLAFITIAGILIVPIAHRILHKFHLEKEGRK